MAEKKTIEGTADIAERCLTYGFEITAVEQKGTVLVLHPSPQATLPAAAELEQIADGISVDGIRYVTIGLDNFIGAGVRDE